MSAEPPELPVDQIIPELRQLLATESTALLSAAPGAGKTTRVPPALLNDTWLGGQKIIMLEPRRLAARNAATFMAAQLGEPVGDTVGYRVRLENRVSARTRIEVVTEGILTRMLLDDPELTGVGLVIFDEFHERHLNSDLALALTHQCQQLLRPDLRLLVMSATLDEQRLADALQAQVLVSTGRSFPVDLHYRAWNSHASTLAQQIVTSIREAMSLHDGDALVFLPGVGDIRKVQALLEDTLPDDWQVLPLHGQLQDAEQKAALAPAAADMRKIILATNIAESSLTIDGVRIVIDSGLERRLQFSPATGLSELKTKAISQASSEQRAGRAGRQAPGVCYRLWPESEQHRRDAHIRAELLDADLAPLRIALLQWGADSDELLWLDKPSKAAMSQAAQLLHQLGIEAGAQLTQHGKACAALALEPRWAHALLQAKALGMGKTACDIAALLQEWPHKQRTTDDLQRLLERARAQSSLWKARAEPLSRRLMNQIQVSQDSQPADSGLITALAWPDLIGRRRANSPDFQLANGRGASLLRETDHPHSDWLVCADVSGGQSVTVRLAASLTDRSLDRLREIAPQLFSRHQDVRWLDNGQFLAEEQIRLGSIVLEAKRMNSLTAEQWPQIWRKFFEDNGISSLNWTDEARQLRARLALAHSKAPDQWPDVSDDGLIAAQENWLLPFCAQARHQRDLGRINLTEALLTLLDWPQQQTLSELLPHELTVPSGSRIAIDYTQPTPVLAVKLQEMFGFEGQPSVWRGQMPLLIHLLSPAGRPLQVTQDLPHFWRNTYADVRKDMRGRYPKHPWPEDPLSAEATRLTKRALAARNGD
ncbi:ATP-dependent helicase HrpB [Thalassolituus sp. LLYu03]|uniref:ATP-dependent helicase HrpB n=1 Tax=Thalassolituus sp. LLYu03 TaxID=3421656 RepID=UPI003D2789FC